MTDSVLAEAEHTCPQIGHGRVPHDPDADYYDIEDVLFALRNELDSAHFNNHHLAADSQGVGPGEYVPAIRSSTIEAVISRFAQPIETVLGCGCAVGLHDNTWEEMKKAHTDMYLIEKLFGFGDYYQFFNVEDL